MFFTQSKNVFNLGSEVPLCNQRQTIVSKLITFIIVYYNTNVLVLLHIILSGAISKIEPFCKSFPWS